MNATTKTLLFLILLVAAGVGIAIMVGGNNGDPELPAIGSSDGSELPPAQQDPGTPMSAAPEKRPAPSKAGVKREAVPSGGAGEHDQGVLGRLVDPRGAPPPPTTIYLMEGSGTDIFRQMVLANRGVRFPPLAKTETDADGNFELGLQNVDASKRYEVRIVTDEYIDKTVPNLTLRKEQWYDVGDIKLAQGVAVTGRVTIEGSAGMPVAQAIVMCKASNLQPVVSPTPGREDGLVAEVDQTGAFRIENVPPGIVNISAVAPGYAKVDKLNTTIDKTAPTTVNFELPRGVSIAGVVIDKAGKPINDASIHAASLSAKVPATGNTRSDRSGNFEVVGLIDGNYLLTVTAGGFERFSDKPFLAGDKEIEIVLEKQGSATVRAYDKNGRVMQRFRLTVKTYFDGQDQFGNTHIPTQSVRTDTNGIATVDGLDSGKYVFQVEAKGHCKSFSEPFEVTPGNTPPLVEVRLTEGGVLEGMVTDARGKPVPGVVVRTMPNHLDENPFTGLFGSLIPYKITKSHTKTDAKGHYKLTLLAPGDYQLKFSHQNFYDVFLKGNQVVAGQNVAIERVVMQTGTIVMGHVTMDGEPAGQVKVTISALPDPNGATQTMFHAEAISMPDGNFVFTKRVPPGSYQVMAAPHSAQNPLIGIIYAQRTKQEITLAGQKQYKLNFAITSER